MSVYKDHKMAHAVDDAGDSSDEEQEEQEE
jgi:hypothetical protein